ncbi:GTPase [Rhodococcus sp. D-6]|uniref:GTPase n=1 Tax=Rhodococcus sp. D-6 TaxID=1387842 RepID=A0AAU7V0Z6_9NOCA|nr:GTPase [Rhodococcus sp. HS-D2]
MSAPHIPPQTGAPDPVHQRIDAALHQLAALGGDLVAHANRIGAILWSPPRIVVVGRLKAGKSTLVNALIGAPVAETAALEATNVVTVYENGAPSRADVVSTDGTRRPVPLALGTTVDLGVPPEQVAYVHRYLPSHALSTITLVDTPGLATLTVTNAAATERALIDGFEQTRLASVDADAAVFLFDSMPRTDEVEFLQRLGFTPLNTLGVLSRADGFGRGVLGNRDPLGHAAEHANVLARRLAGQVGTVVPVAGLLAQTSHTGAFTDADARALAALDPLAPLELFDLLDADPAALPVPRDQVWRLLELIGEYGLVHARAQATGGAHQVNQWLSGVSGVHPLRAVLEQSLRRFAVLHRAGRILAELDALVYSHPARDAIRQIVSALRTDPALVPVELLRALRSLLQADPSAPAVDELVQVLRGGTIAEALGLEPTASPEQIRAMAQQKLVAVQAQSVSTRSAAEDTALTALTHAYTVIVRGH